MKNLLCRSNPRQRVPYVFRLNKLETKKES